MTEPLLKVCGHQVPINFHCIECGRIRAIVRGEDARDAADIPATGNPREPQADERLSRWPEWLRAWRWPSDAEGA